MFERFTDRARQVVVLAQDEARRLDHNYIGTEHILLGLLREGDGVAAQVLVKLGADLNRVRQQVIQLLHGYQGEEPRPARRDAVEQRLAALEQQVGIRPDTSDLDEQIAQVRREKESAIYVKDFLQAASLRSREKELLAAKTALEKQWAAGHPALPDLAERVQQLADEIERLRALLRQHGIDPQDKTA